METKALVELMKEGNKVLKGTGDRYLKPDLTVVPDPPPAVGEGGKPLGNVLALRWVDLALKLERENAELRRIATVLFCWIMGREELAAYAMAAVGARFEEPVEVPLAA